MIESKVPDVRRLLGSEGNVGKGLGLTKDWVARIVRAVGNCGESFEHNLGGESRLKRARGANSPWTKSGLQYAPLGDITSASREALLAPVSLCFRAYLR